MSIEQETQFQSDRAGWAPGPWDNELDRYDFVTQAGLLGAMLRHKYFGHWCGYVGVEAPHPCYGKYYGTLECRVHGGLTYSGKFPTREYFKGPWENLWWFGFDCHHYQDMAPGDAVVVKGAFSFPCQKYRDRDYVRDQVEQLASQLSESKPQ